MSHMDMKLGLNPDHRWMPFGDDTRRCLGERLAMTEIKAFLATLANRLDFDLVGPTSIRFFGKR